MKRLIDEMKTEHTLIDRRLQVLERAITFPMTPHLYDITNQRIGSIHPVPQNAGFQSLYYNTFMHDPLVGHQLPPSLTYPSLHPPKPSQVMSAETSTMDTSSFSTDISVCSTDHDQDTLSDITTETYNGSSEAGSVLSSAKVTTSKGPLPQINKFKLSSPEDVVKMHPKLVKLSKIPTLSVKLAKEAYFGKDIMAVCTVRGLGNYHALPETELKELKMYLRRLCIPRLVTNHVEFEQTWKVCTESIGQACKALRTQKP